MSGYEWVLALSLVTIAATVQAALGFGMNMVAMPTLVLIDTDLVPGPALMAAIVLTLCVFARERRSFEASTIRWAVVGRIIGTMIGLVAVSQVDEDGLQLMVAVGVLVMAGVTMMPNAPARTPRTMVFAGVFSGVGGATAGIGGPPVALLFQRAPGPTIRSSMAGFFIVASLVTILGLAAIGEFGAHEFGLGLGLAPAAVAGFLLSGPLVPVVDRGITRPALLAVSVGTALVIIVRLTVG